MTGNVLITTSRYNSCLSTFIGLFTHSIYRNEDTTAVMATADTTTEATMAGKVMEVMADTVTAATVTATVATDTGIMNIAADTIIKYRILRQDQYHATSPLPLAIPVELVILGSFLIVWINTTKVFEFDFQH